MFPKSTVFHDVSKYFYFDIITLSEIKRICVFSHKHKQPCNQGQVIIGGTFRMLNVQ